MWLSDIIGNNFFDISIDNEEDRKCETKIKNKTINRKINPN